MKNLVCHTCTKNFILSADDLAFIAGREISIPTQCHICIWKHLLSFWVFGTFRKTTSALSGKTIITTFPEDIPFPLYARDEWVGDAWDALEYGQVYDPERPFMDQFSELFNKVPRPHQSGTKNVDCQWSDDVWNSKNCYLSRSMVECEDSSYLYRVLYCRDSIDATFCFNSEYLYDCTYCFKSSKLKYCFDARDSVDSAFLYDCRNCQDCFMSWNLRNKRYCIENVQYTKEEYFEKIAVYDLKSFSEIAKLKAAFAKHIEQDAVHRAGYNIKTVGSIGNFMEECKNCIECYYIQFSENSRYVLRGGYLKDVMYGVSTLTEKSCMSVMDGYTYDVVASSHSSNTRYSAYIEYCEDCEYCFGCVGLRKKKYCILNTQYTEEEYDRIVSEIKTKMREAGIYGQFFPMNLAYSGYNTSTGAVYLPMTKEEVIARGGKWEDEESSSHDGISGNEVPDSIDDIDEVFTQQAIICPETNKRFNIAPHELAFYKRFGIPAPQYHSDYRTLERLTPLTITSPEKYQCIFCSKDIIAYYPKEWAYKKIACEDCYLKEIS